MSGFFKKIRLVIILGVITALLSAAASALGDMSWTKRLLGDKFYEELELRVEAQILPDGSMNVKETRVLEFSGEFSRYRRQIPHSGFRNLTDVKVSEPNTPYTLIQNPTGRPENRFTFSKDKTAGNGQFVVELFFHAKDQKKTFIIEYHVTDVVQLHNDVAEVYWKFIGAPRSVDIDKMSVTLLLPVGAQPDEIKVWGHGPLKGDVKKIDGSQLSWHTTDLPKNRFLEGRVVFPLRLVQQGRNLTHKDALASILAQEQAWAAQRAKEQREALILTAISVVIAIIGIGSAWWIFRRFGRKFKPSLEVEYYRELPGNYSPAEAACLIGKGLVKPQAVAATFMDLARRGYLRLEPAHNSAREDILVRQLKPIGEELASHERYLLDFFFNRVGAMQPVVWFSALEGYRKSDPAGTKDFVTSFQTAVKEKVDAMGYIETGNRAKKFAVYGFFTALISTYICYDLEWFAPMLAFLASMIAFMVAGFRSRDFTREGQEQVDLWDAFRRFLKDFSNLEHAQLPQLILWEHYLVYAVVLGVAAEVIRQLPIVYPQVSEPDSHFGYYWGGMYHSQYGSDGMIQQTSFSGFASFNDIVTSLGDTWNGTYSAMASSVGGSSGSSDSGGGDGGGFSGGGGDGGGGGGGDAD